MARLQSELTSAHESVLNSDKSRALLAKQVSELQARLEDTESTGGKGLKNQIRKLEQRVRVLLWIDTVIRIIFRANSRREDKMRENKFAQKISKLVLKKNTCKRCFN